MIGASISIQNRPTTQNLSPLGRARRVFEPGEGLPEHFRCVTPPWLQFTNQKPKTPQLHTQKIPNGVALRGQLVLDFAEVSGILLSLLGRSYGATCDPRLEAGALSDLRTGSSRDADWRLPSVGLPTGRQFRQRRHLGQSADGRQDSG